MVAVVLSLLLGAVLLGSAALKLADGPRTRLALGTYGLRGESAAIVWAALIAVEPVLGVAVAVGVESAAWAAAALFGVFAAAQAALLMSGRAGAPCACFGSRGRVGRGSLGTAGRLTGVFTLFSPLPGPFSAAAAPFALDGGLARHRAGRVAARRRRARGRGARAGARARRRPRGDQPARGARDPRGGAGARWPHGAHGGRAGPARAGGVHLRGLRDVPRARACDRGARPRPAGSPAHLRRGPRRPRVGGGGDPGQPVRGGDRCGRD